MSDVETAAVFDEAAQRLDTSYADTQANVSPGRLLRQAREQSGISIEEASACLKLSTAYLQALELDDYDSLVAVASVFVRGHLRSYARFLSVDPDRVLLYYANLHAHVEAMAAPENTTVEPPNAKPMPRRLMLLGLAVLVLCLAVYWFFFNHGSQTVKSMHTQLASNANLPIAQPDAPLVPQPSTLKQEFQLLPNQANKRQAP